ncbi:MAG: hypothetical protein AAFR93_01260 [Pseudomonadota bacterium]
MTRVFACALVAAVAACSPYAPVQRDATQTYQTPVERTGLASLWGVGPRAQDRISYPDDAPDADDTAKDKPTAPEATRTAATAPAATPASPAPTSPSAPTTGGTTPTAPAPGPGPGLFPGVPPL